MTMYQKCPICNGTGVISASLKIYKGEKCDVCNGKKIIDSKTGKPPKEEKINTEIQLHEKVIIEIINILPESFFR